MSTTVDSQHSADAPSSETPSARRESGESSIWKTLGSTVGRFVFAIPFLMFGAFHFMNADQMAGMVPSFIPGGVFWVYMTGVALIAAPIAIMFDKWARWAAVGLAGMLAVFALTIHLPGIFDEATRQMSMTSFLKDMALAGAALMAISALGWKNESRES